MRKAHKVILWFSTCCKHCHGCRCHPGGYRCSITVTPRHRPTDINSQKIFLIGGLDSLKINKGTYLAHLVQNIRIILIIVIVNR